MFVQWSVVGVFCLSLGRSIGFQLTGLLAENQTELSSDLGLMQTGCWSKTWGLLTYHHVIFTRMSRPKGIERSVILTRSSTCPEGVVCFFWFKGIDNDHLETPQRSFSPVKPIPDGEGDRNLGPATISRTWSRTWAKFWATGLVFRSRSWIWLWKIAKPPRWRFSGAFF